VLARRERRPPYDWRPWIEQFAAETPPGMPRLRRMARSAPLDPPRASALAGALGFSRDDLLAFTRTAL
jgi:hypothetical protein